MQVFADDHELMESGEPIADSSGDVLVRRTRFDRDPAGRKTTETVDTATVPSDLQGAATLVEAGRQVGYRWQATGWLAREFDASAGPPEPGVAYLQHLDGTLASASDDTAGIDVDLTVDWQLDGQPAEVVTTVGGDPFAAVTGAWRPDGERAARAVASGGQTGSQSWVHNGAGFVESTSVDFGDSTGESASWSWSSAGVLAGATYGSVSESRTHLADGTLASISAAGGTHSYTTDGLGRVVDHTITGIAAAPSRSYGYDGASRVVDDGAGLGGFGWDPNTNRTSHHGVVSTYRADNTVATVDSATVDFDAAGRRVHPKTTATDCEYRYDALNRTVGVVAASGQTCGDQAAYLHDPLGRQIIDVAGEDVDPADVADGIANGWLELDNVIETHSVFDLLENDLLATLGWDTTGTGTDTDRSTYATGPQGAWATRHSGTATSHGTQVLLSDGRRNTSLVTTPAGTQTCARHYDPFGGTDGASTCGTGDTANQLWYRGGQQDTTTGTYQYGARHYDPDTATWTTPDTADPHSGLTDLGVGTDPLTANRYTYVNGNPINTHDPSGHCTEELSDDEYEECVQWLRGQDLYETYEGTSTGDWLYHQLYWIYEDVADAQAAELGVEPDDTSRDAWFLGGMDTYRACSLRARDVTDVDDAATYSGLLQACIAPRSVSQVPIFLELAGGPIGDVRDARTLVFDGYVFSAARRGVGGDCPGGRCEVPEQYELVVSVRRLADGSTAAVSELRQIPSSLWEKVVRYFESGDALGDAEACSAGAVAVGAPATVVLGVGEIPGAAIGCVGAVVGNRVLSWIINW